MLHLKAIGLVLIAILSVQVGAAFAKSLFPLIGPEATTVLRIWLGAVMLAAFYRPWRTRLTRQAKQAIALYGISLGLMNFVFYLSIARIPLGLAVALEFLGPLTVAIVGSRRPIDFLWVVMAGTGIYLVLPTSGLEAELDPLGIAQALIAGAFWALYIVFGKRLGKEVPGGVATCLGMIMAGITVLPVAFLHIADFHAEPRVLLLGATVALLSGAIPYSLEMTALRSLPTHVFGLLMSLEPAMAACAAFVILGEALSPVQWAAIASIMVASAGTSVTSRPGD